MNLRPWYPKISQQWKNKGMVPGRARRFEVLRSLDDSAGGALVDAGAAVAAFSGIDNCDVIAGDCGLRADVDACSACDTLGLVD